MIEGVLAVLKRTTLGLGTVLLFTSCGVLPLVSTEKAVKHRAFITYWPPPMGDKRIKLALKDNIDMQGVVTTAGSEYLAKHSTPALKDAACLSAARARKDVVIVGKTNLSEFAVSPTGVNEYFGTPHSPLKDSPKLLPGGSSCGSAVAVAHGDADVAFGTDTAGSVRVPAACCGIVGLKTTKGLVSVEGVYPVEPAHLDTIGPLAKDIAHTVVGMDLLQAGFASRYASATAAKPNAGQIRIARLTVRDTDPQVDAAIDDALAKAGFQVVMLDRDFTEKWEAAKNDGNTVAAAGVWMSDKQHRYSFEVAPRTKTIILVGRIAQLSYQGALARQAAWQAALRQVFRKADFIALPTIQGTPPPLKLNLRIGISEALMLKEQNTAAVNFAGNPALALPIPLKGDNVKISSLQLVGPMNSEPELLNAGRLVEAAVQDKMNKRSFLSLLMPGNW